jgi:hypothetical protein
MAVNNDYIYDIETYPNCFTLAVESADAPFQWMFEISPWKNDSRGIIEFLHGIKAQNGRMVGFNNVGFDYPVIHSLVQMGNATPQALYQKAMAIIGSQNEDRFAHWVKPSDRFVEQLDLFKVHHFDNMARSTSLKILEFNMRMDNIEDLPFPVGTELNQQQIEVLKKYNKHDVKATKQFYHESLPMISFREELTHKYQRDFMNHNDTKIGKDYFQMKLEEAGVQLYSFGQGGRRPVQTPRPVIKLNECILPSIQFEQSEFTRVLNWLKSQEIVETKGVFKGLIATIKGFHFVFGLGGIHGSIDSEVVESDDEYTLEDWDVASYYPNLAIANNFHPEHLGDTFCSIYKHLYEQRKGHKKGTAENAMLKLALNGVYGDSNSKFSVFYDPQFTMSITLNGQLLLCKLAEELMKVPDLRLIQINTDGLTIRYPRGYKDHAHSVCKWWEDMTRLELESAVYSRMFIRDVNNYIAEYEGGGVKRKGTYEYDLGWHQNASALVIPMVAEQVLLHGVSIRETLESHGNKMDFMLRTKVPRSSKLVQVSEDGTDYQIQNVTRYYIAEGGNKLIKLMPPTPKMLSEGKTDWRRIGIESGWGVQVCNNLEDQDLPIDYNYYVQEIEKRILGLA